MEPVMKSNSYGKTRVRITKLMRKVPNHEIKVLNCEVRLRGAFEKTYTHGDNSSVIATDSIRNTVYAMGSDADIESPEQFGLRVTNHFVKTYQHVRSAEIYIVEDLWDRIPTPSGPHPTAWVGRGVEKRVAKVTVSRTEGTRVEGGIKGLSVLRTKGSEFSGFVTDQYRLLPDSKDRIFATVIEASWKYNIVTADFNATYRRMRDAVCTTFANHHSLSVQQTMHEAGLLMLRQCPDTEELSLFMPNVHHVPFDLSRLGGRKNKNEIFVTTDEPSGTIYETLTRARSKL